MCCLIYLFLTLWSFFFSFFFFLVGISILHTVNHGLRQLASIYKRLLFRLQPSRFGIAERGKFDNVSIAPLAVAKAKSELTENEI